MDGLLTTYTKRLTSPAVRGTAKSAVRSYAQLSSGRRRLPDFLVIGAKRCGTTSLQNYLLAHWGVAPLFPRVQNIKGVHYFDRNANQPISWYRSFFPLDLPGRRSRICGEASPYYFIHPRAAERAAEAVPRAKIIALLREPAQRALSHYRDEVRNRHEPLSLREAVAAEPGRLDAALDRMRRDEHYYSFVHEHLCYLTWGRYAEHLARWLAVFPPERVLVLRSEDLFERPAELYGDVTRFLNLPSYIPNAFPRYNATPQAAPDDSATAALRRYYAPHNSELAKLLPQAAGWDWPMA